jgi:hypothetical protein
MTCIRYLDGPDYTVDVLEGAKPIGSQFAVAAGLLTVLMVAMSAMEEPIRPQYLYATDVSGLEGPSAPALGPPCLIGEKVRDWIAKTTS